MILLSIYLIILAPVKSPMVNGLYKCKHLNSLKSVVAALVNFDLLLLINK